MLKKIKACFQLTKPSIMLLVVITGMTALFLEKSLLADPARFFAALFALYLTGGCANAMNQYFERNVDARMSRTRTKRPLPSGRILPNEALIFSIGIGVAGVLIFAMAFNWFSAALAVGTILFYSFFYTLWLKPTTPQNIVIGGAAGAMGPVIAWAAAANSLSWTAILLFLIIFLWTPPHFWALALYYKEDYREVGYPMMPLIKGDITTLRQMWLYSVATVVVSLLLYYLTAGLLYLVVAVGCGLFFIFKTYRDWQNPTPTRHWQLFGYSIVYLLGLFFALIIDSFLL